jgi:hypothetical protein
MTMQISGSTRKRADTFAPEESFQTVQFDSEKVYVSMPEADTEHVRPLGNESGDDSSLNGKNQLKERLKKSLQTISNSEKEITTLIAKIDRERSYISGMIEKM